MQSGRKVGTSLFVPCACHTELNADLGTVKSCSLPQALPLILRLTRLTFPVHLLNWLPPVLQASVKQYFLQGAFLIVTPKLGFTYGCPQRLLTLLQHSLRHSCHILACTLLRAGNSACLEIWSPSLTLCLPCSQMPINVCWRNYDAHSNNNANNGYIYRECIMCGVLC